MKTVQLWTPTGKKLGGLHPAVARRMIKEGHAVQAGDRLTLASKMPRPLQYERMEVSWHPITEGITFNVDGDEPPAHCVLNIYVDDTAWSKGRHLEILTHGGGRMGTRGFHQLIEDDDESYRWLTTEEWLSRLDKGELVTWIPPQDGADIESLGNVWVIRHLEDGKEQAIQLWIALHYPHPHPKDIGNSQVPEELLVGYPCVFIAVWKPDFTEQIRLPKWWHED